MILRRGVDEALVNSATPSLTYKYECLKGLGAEHANHVRAARGARRIVRGSKVRTGVCLQAALIKPDSNIRTSQNFYVHLYKISRLSDITI